jgi:flavin-dependent dehydrogenase
MKTPVAIVGAGPGGSALAVFLAKQGIQSTLIEREAFPRYHIGESMTGECGGVVRALGLEQKMLDRRYPVKWGVHVYGHNPWFVPVRQRTAQNELQDTFTWQVRRSDFDALMLDEAIAAGAHVVPGRASIPLVRDDGSVRGVRVEMADGGVQEIETEVLADVSGQARWLTGSGLTSKLEIGHYDKQVAIFSQVRNAIPFEGRNRADTIIFYKQLVHWAWFIPIDDEVTSVGVVSPGSYFTSKRESKRDFLLRELRELHPELKRRVPDLTLIEEVRAVQNYSYQVHRFTGKGWLCIGDAHRFIDPIFSFGLYASMKEAQFAASAIKAYLEGAHRDAADPFAAHAALCDRGLDKFQDLIDAFWSHPLAFAVVAHHKHPDGTVDLFAGRIYGDDANPALEAMRQIKQHKRSWWDEKDNWWEGSPAPAAELSKPV